MKREACILAGLIFAVGLMGCNKSEDAAAGGATTAGANPAPKPTAPAPTFAAVQTILNANCISCHGIKAKKEDLDLTNHAGVMKGSEHGAVVNAGDPDTSPIILFIKGTKTPRMPMGANPLSDADTQVIADWIKAGAAA